MAASAYLSSPEKRHFDVFASNLLRPTAYAAKLILTASDPEHGTREFTQTRIGRNGQPFEMYKWYTLRDDVEFSKTARLMRQNGIDELAQLANVRNGQMGVFGFRCYLPQDHSAFLDRLDVDIRKAWLRDVLPTTPGMLSPASALAHTGAHATSNDRAELDIAYVEQASLQHDLAWLAETVGRALHGEFIISRAGRAPSEAHR